MNILYYGMDLKYIVTVNIIILLNYCEGNNLPKIVYNQISVYRKSKYYVDLKTYQCLRSKCFKRLLLPESGSPNLINKTEQLQKSIVETNEYKIKSYVSLKNITLKKIPEICKQYMCPEFYKYQEESALIIRKKKFRPPITCGKNVTYYLSKDQQNNEDSKSLCCAAKLKMAEVTTDEERECLSTKLNLTKGQCNLYVGAWDLSEKKEDGRKIMTCPDLKPVITSRNVWGAKHPFFKNRFEPLAANCMVYIPCKKDKDYGLVDQYCNIRFNVLCQATKMHDIYDVMAKQPVPYNIVVFLTMEKTGTIDCNLASFPRIRNMTGVKNNLTRSFAEIKCTGKTFYISKSVQNAKESRGICSNSGLYMGEVLTAEELLCLSSTAKYLGTLTLHTSVSDISLNRTFYTCPGLQKVPDNLWAKNEPNNGVDLSENCAIITLCKRCPKLGYHDTLCVYNYNVLCQLERFVV